MLFTNEHMEGIDMILLRTRKTSFGDKKHRPQNSTDNNPRNNKAELNCECSKCRPDLYEQE